jgi:hypothetical protein
MFADLLDQPLQLHCTMPLLVLCSLYIQSAAASTEIFTFLLPCTCVQSPKLMAYSHIRIVRVLLSWMPRIMRLLGQDFPNIGILLKVNGEGKIVEVLGDKTGAVVSRVTSAFESEDGQLLLGSLHKRGVPVVDLKGARA